MSWWRLRWHNCSISDNPEFINKPYGDFDDVHAGFHRRDYDPAQIVFFTTRQDGHQLNLTALSSGDDYDKTQSLIFDVKDYLPVPPSLDGGGMTSCAQLAAAIPSPTPASLDPDTASSIMVSLTRAECYATAPAKPHGYGSLWLAPGYF